MEVNRLNYNKSEIKDAEPDLGFDVKRTLTVKDNDVLNFRIPPDSEKFSDLNSILLKIQLKIVKSDGSDCGNPNKPFLDWNGISSLFSSCDVRFDGVIVSSMTSYPYTAALCRWLGASEDMRNLWYKLDGSEDPCLNTSDIQGGTPMEMKLSPYSQKYSKSKTVVLWGRIYSDILLSSRQYLPPNVELGVELRRAPDKFSINCHSNGTAYRIYMDWASLYLKRLSIKPSLLSKPLSTLKHDASMIFNRLETRIQSMPRGQSIWQWLDCLNGATLPNRIYVGFVTQEALYGKYTRYSTFFESLCLSSFNVKLNGRDIMTEPLTAKYQKATGPPSPPPSASSSARGGRGGNRGGARVRHKRSINIPGGIDIHESEAREPFMALMDIFDQIKDMTGNKRFTYTEYLQGKSILALELGKCGEKSGTSGTVDLEVTKFIFIS